MTAVSYSLIHGEGIELPTIFAADRTPVPYQVESIDDRLLHHYSPMPALLDAPVVAAYELLGVTPATPGGYWRRDTEIRIMHFEMALASALVCVVLYFTARRLLAPLYALGLTLAFAFGTQIFSTLSRPYWSHTWGVALTALAIYFVVFRLRNRATLSAVLGATCISWSFFCRPQTAWAVIGLGVFLVVSRRWRDLGVFTSVGVAWAVVGALFSLATYDSILPNYFLGQQVELGRFEIATRVTRHRYFWNLMGSLFSPSRGVFIFVPLYAWILAVVCLSWKRLASRPLAVIAVAVIGVHLWMLVHTGTWPGGSRCYGPRQLSDVLPWFFLLGALAVDAMLTGWRETSRWGRSLRLASLMLCLAFSIFVNTRGAYAPATWRWMPAEMVDVRRDGEEVIRPDWWDWSDPQFLAGLWPEDPPRRDAGDEAGVNGGGGAD